jgi:hypothetical protein
MIFKYSGADTKHQVKLVSGNAIRFKQDRGWKESQYNTPNNLRSVPNFNSLKPVRIRTVSRVNYQNTGGNWPGYGRRDNFGARWTGKMTITRSGSYRFRIGSDDGSMLYINNRRIVDNNGLHGFRWRQGDTGMKSGKSSVRLEFFERGGHAGMKFYYLGSDTRRRLILVPPSVMETDL